METKQKKRKVRPIGPVLPDGYTPEGVGEQERDEQTRKWVEEAVAGGEGVLSHLLGYATLTPEATMEAALLATVEQNRDEAIVLITTIAALAHSPGSPYRSPDGYGRRLVALESLGVIRRRVHRGRGYTEIGIRLGQLPLALATGLSALWEVHEGYRDEKVKQLARKIAKQLRKKGELSGTLPRHEVDEELAPIADLLGSLLEAEGLDLDEALLCKASGVIASLLLPHKYGSADEKLGELKELLKRRKAPRKKAGESSSRSKKYEELFRVASTSCEAENGRVEEKEGESAQTETTTLRPNSSIVCAQTGESAQTEAATWQPNSPILGHTGAKTGESAFALVATLADKKPSLTDSLTKTGELETQKPTNAPKNGGDSPTFCAAVSKKVAKTGELRSESAETGQSMGVSVPAVSISDQYPGDISLVDHRTLIDKGTTGSASEGGDSPKIQTDRCDKYQDPRPIQEIRREAGSLATFLDGRGNARWMGTLVNRVRDYPPDLRRLAVIDALYHKYFPDHRGKPRLLGAWFCNACVWFTQSPSSVPEAVKAWAQTDLSYDQIRAQLARRQQWPRPLTQATPADEQPVETEISSYVAPSADEEYQARQEREKEAKMSLAVAERLVEEINREHGQEGLRARVGRSQDGSYVVVTVWSGVREEHGSVASWRKYYGEVRELLDEEAACKRE